MIVNRAARLPDYFDDDYFRPDPDLWERLCRTLPIEDRVRRRQRRLRVLLAVAVVALLATMSAVPAAAGASPISPVPRAVLAAAGLASVTERFMPVQGSATWSGFTINLVAAYADDIRTVVVLRAEPRAKADGLFPRGLVAFDASGHLLGLHSGTSLDGSNYVLRFDPVPRGQSSQAKLTLLIWQLDSTLADPMTRSSGCGPCSSRPPLRGATSCPCQRRGIPHGWVSPSTRSDRRPARWRSTSQRGGCHQARGAVIRSR